MIADLKYLMLKRLYDEEIIKGMIMVNEKNVFLMIMQLLNFRDIER